MLGYDHEEKAKNEFALKKTRVICRPMQSVSNRELRASSMTGHVTQF